MRCPAPRPASYSVWPTWVNSPNSAATSLPEFIEMTGIPASTAALIESPSASASGIETTRPSGCEATAASIHFVLTEYLGAGAEARGERDGQQRYQPDETVHRCLRFLFLRWRRRVTADPPRSGVSGAADPDI